MCGLRVSCKGKRKGKKKKKKKRRSAYEGKIRSPSKTIQKKKRKQARLIGAGSAKCSGKKSVRMLREHKVQRTLFFSLSFVLLYRPRCAARKQSLSVCFAMREPQKTKCIYECKHKSIYMKNNNNKKEAPQEFLLLYHTLFKEGNQMMIINRTEKRANSQFG